MKKALFLSLLIGFWFTSGCSNAQPLPSKKVLIVCLSRTNNTKAIAEMIHRNVGGTLVALELEKPYPAHYQATVQQVADENETGYLPPLKTSIDSLEKYQVVFEGFPAWGMKLPPLMKRFLHQYNLGRKQWFPSIPMPDTGKAAASERSRNAVQAAKYWKAW